MLEITGIHMDFARIRFEEMVDYVDKVTRP